MSNTSLIFPFSFLEKILLSREFPLSAPLFPLVADVDLYCIILKGGGGEQSQN